MLPLDATLAQINAAADILETDAGNRLGALTKGLEGTRARINARPGSAAAPEGIARVSTKAERDALPAGTQYIGPDGKSYTKR
jgi:hypothetical protein